MRTTILILVALLTVGDVVSAAAPGVLGTVTYVGKKGDYAYAFVKPDKGQGDVYVPGHLLPAGIKQGTRVEFNAVQSDRGQKAISLTIGKNLPPPPKKDNSAFFRRPKGAGKQHTHYLKWNAPRGNNGKPGPEGDEWETFLGKPSARHLAGYAKPEHAVGVALTGVKTAPVHRTSTVQQIASLLQKRGVSKVVADKAAVRVQLGLPSGADTQAKDDYLIARKDSVLSYSSSRKSPNWVAWTTSTDDMGKGFMRSDDKWRTDPALPSGFGYTTFHDYQGAGYDPGHMVRSAERTRSPRMNERTYLTSNTLPQSFNNNRGPWLRFENYYSDTLKQNDLVAHVIAGGVYGRKPLTIGKGVPVPNATWKIVMLLPRGKTMADVTAETRVVSILVPNNDKKVSTTETFRNYLTTPGEIEKLTGLRFFDALPKKVADALRTTKRFNFGYREIPERGLN